MIIKVEPGKEVFEPIRDIVCDGRDMRDMLPQIPNYYEYGSELIFHYQHDEHWHHVVSPRNNWFDQEMQVSKIQFLYPFVSIRTFQVARLDYKPLVLDHDNNGDPYDSMIAVQTDIQDFEAAIAYQLDTVCELSLILLNRFNIFHLQNFGNCSIVPINKDMAGDLNVADGRIQSPDPMHIFFMDQKFAYNGMVSLNTMYMYSPENASFVTINQHKERGIWMDYFTTEIPSKTGKK